jgi:hypothetical protein
MSDNSTEAASQEAVPPGTLDLAQALRHAVPPAPAGRHAYDGSAEDEDVDPEYGEHEE